MATNPQPQETPEYRTFREHYSRLYNAIQDPLSLAIQLFSQGIIASAVKENMSVSAFSRLEKNNALLSAVEMQVRTNPSTYYAFLSALEKDTSLQSLVESLQSKCYICQESPEYRIFRDHYSRLYHAIQDPLSLANRLFTQGIIPSAVKENMSVSTFSRLEKNGALLSAVEMQIRTNSRTYYVFLSALKVDTSLQSLVESLQSKCYICQESPEYRIFRDHYSRLYHAIQDPLSLANRLFTQGIIPSAVKENMSVSTFSRLEKNGALLSAVEMQIRTNSRTYYVFLSALNEDPSMQPLVESMQSKYLYCVKTNTVTSKFVN